MKFELQIVITFEGKAQLRRELDQNVRIDKENANTDKVFDNDVYKASNLQKTAILPL